MRLVCPCCQAEYPLQAAINDVAARNAVVSAFKLTTLGDLLLAYVQLYKPAKSALSMSRLAKLLDELVALVKTGTIERNGRTWSAPQAYWQQAMEAMLASREKLSLPLKSNGYLFEIIVSYANKAEGRQEKLAEQGRIYGQEKLVTKIPKVVEKKPRSEMPEEVRKTLRNLTGRKD